MKLTMTCGCSECVNTLPPSSLSRVTKGTRISVAVGDVSMTLQKAFREELPIDSFNPWISPEAVKEKKFTEKSDMVCCMAWD